MDEYYENGQLKVCKQSGDEYHENGFLKKNGYNGDTFNDRGERTYLFQRVKPLHEKKPPFKPEYYENGNLHVNFDNGDEFYPDGRLKKNGETGEEFFPDGRVKKIKR